jgi:hypothetical protein
VKIRRAKDRLTQERPEERLPRTKAILTRGPRVSSANDNGKRLPGLGLGALAPFRVVAHAHLFQHVLGAWGVDARSTQNEFTCSTSPRLVSGSFPRTNCVSRFPPPQPGEPPPVAGGAGHYDARVLARGAPAAAASRRHERRCHVRSFRAYTPLSFMLSRRSVCAPLFARLCPHATLFARRSVRTPLYCSHAALFACRTVPC